MNRFKKELRRRGYKLDCDFPYLPYEIAPNIFIETSVADAETAMLSEWTNALGWTRLVFDRTMKPVELSDIPQSPVLQ